MLLFLFGTPQRKYSIYVIGFSCLKRRIDKLFEKDSTRSICSVWFHKLLFYILTHICILPITVQNLYRKRYYQNFSIFESAYLFQNTSYLCFRVNWRVGIPTSEQGKAARYCHSLSNHQRHQKFLCSCLWFHWYSLGMGYAEPRYSGIRTSLWAHFTVPTHNLTQNRKTWAEAMERNVSTGNHSHA